jgi:23S rRNA (pseudouridine1915-N3)-methyltransferase
VASLPKVTVLAFGKLRKDPFATPFDFYWGRASQYFELQLVELRSSELKDPLAAKVEEEASFRKWLSVNGGGRPALILLSERGKNLKSEEWAEAATRYIDQARSPLVFAIGGAFGFSEGLEKHADLLLSFGKQTLAHELARVVLMEQIYRAGTIRTGHPYHHV